MAGVAPFNRDDDSDSEVFPFIVYVVFAFVVFLFAVLLLLVFITVNAICLKRRRLRMPRRQSATAADEDPLRIQRLRLQKSVIETFPVFVYRSESFGDEGLECAVCLSDFEENEKGRRLPMCKHSFHVECIDKWFKTQSVCPLCRTVAQADPQAAEMDHVLVTVAGETSDASCQHVNLPMQ